MNLRIGEVGQQRSRREEDKEQDSQEKAGVVAAVGGVAQANNHGERVDATDEGNDADPLHHRGQGDYKREREHFLDLIKKGQKAPVAQHQEERRNDDH